jgi:hypothetical protein
VSDEELLHAEELDDLIALDEAHDKTKAGSEVDPSDEGDKPKSRRTVPPPLPRT